jgi:hypothetical protein
MLDELRTAGKRDLDRNLEALTTACSQYAPQATVADCASDEIQRRPTGRSRRRAAAPDAAPFIVDHGIVTIPSDEIAHVGEAPPYRRFNAAYIQVPGPFEHGLPSIYYIAPPDPTWSEADQKAYIPSENDLLFISAHEVWPGHFLQNLYSNQTRIGNIFGARPTPRAGRTTAEMMWDAGLGNGDAGAHVGQLVNALLRNVRFMSAIGLHTEGMTVEQSVQMFETQAYQDHGNALQQARRGTFDPNYLSYTLGKLMILKLRTDWTAGHPSEHALRDFHDKLLSYGEPPLPLVRKYMLGADHKGIRACCRNVVGEKGTSSFSAVAARGPPENEERPHFPTAMIVATRPHSGTCSDDLGADEQGHGDECADNAPQPAAYDTDRNTMSGLRLSRLMMLGLTSCPSMKASREPAGTRMPARHCRTSIERRQRAAHRRSLRPHSAYLQRDDNSHRTRSVLP